MKGVCGFYLIALVITLHWLIVSGDYTLTVLHTNDVHCRFESFNKYKRACSSGDIENRTCWGGVARLRTAVNRYRQEDQNTILLDGGDQYQGTMWYTILKWEPINKYMNVMGYDAVSLGNHEFDDGPEGLAPHLKALNTTVIASNIRDHGSPIKGLFQRKAVKVIGGQKIGLIGYTSLDTPELSSPGELLEFEGEVKSLQVVADELTKEGVDKIIAFGHSGIGVDREICKKVKGVDIVVGGHTNTFLYTGEAPSTEVAEGPYPEVYTSTGTNCLVSQSYAFGKYLGRLKVVFDDHGVPKNWTGSNPILIEAKEFPADKQVEAILAPYKARLDAISKQVIGMTAVGLDSRDNLCRKQECNLGNLVTDAAVFYLAEKAGREMKAGSRKLNGAWSRVAIGIWNGGGIRDFYTSTWTNMTMEDLITIMPFQNTLEVVRLKGDVLFQVFEHSVGEYTLTEPPGRFLQVSGVKVVYDLSKSNGNRVVSLSVRCAQCDVPDYAPVDREKEYDVVTVKYLIDGGDGYSVLTDNILKRESSEVLDTDLLMDYFKRHQPIMSGIEGRIMFQGGIKASSGLAVAVSSWNCLSVLIVLGLGHWSGY